MRHRDLILKWHNVSYTWNPCLVVPFTVYLCVVNLQGVPVCKKRRLGVTLPSLAQQDNWISGFNLEGRIRTSQNEVGDGATSRVMLEPWMVSLLLLAA